MSVAVATRGMPTAGQKPYQPYGAARQLLYDRSPQVLLAGPAGTGKTRACLEKLHICAEKYAGMRAVILRKTRASLTQSAMVTFVEHVLPAGAGVWFHHESQEYRYPNGSVIAVGGLDKSSRIMSTEFDMAYIPEATELTEDDWENVSTRLRNGVMPYQQLIADCNPQGPKHWLRQRAIARKTVMYESRHQDNPRYFDHRTKTWTPAGIAYMAKLDALTGTRRLRLRDGIWAAAEGMVYDQWDPAVHVIDRFEIPASWPRYWVIDYGYTNPFVWQAWAEDGDGRLFRYREIYMTRRLVADHATAILEAAAGEPWPVAIVTDHDAEDRATFERATGLRTLPAFKAVTPGIQGVQRRLRAAGDGRPRLFFLRDSLVEVDEELLDAKKPICTEDEFEGYVWDTTGAQRPGAQRRGDQPVKRDDHGMDTTRYLVAFVDDLALDPSDVAETVVHEEMVEISPY